MKKTATYILLLFLFVVFACKKERINLPELSYVNLKYPAVGQKSLYRVYERDIYTSCENIYIGDTIVMEIIEENEDGFIIQETLTVGSYSAKNNDGKLGNYVTEPYLRSLKVEGDTAFLTRIQGTRVRTLFPSKIPLRVEGHYGEEINNCLPILFVPILSAPPPQYTQPITFRHKEVTINGKTATNAITSGFVVDQIEGGLIFENTFSTYHHLLRSIRFDVGLLASWDGVELITH